MGRAKLTHVAVRFQGQIWSLPKPYRHHHIFRVIAYLGEDLIGNDPHGDDQGFLDETGRYLTRRQAQVNAELNNQIKGGKLIGSILTSEDLW